LVLFCGYIWFLIFGVQAPRPMAMKKEIIQTRNRKMNKKLIIKVRETFFSLIRRVADSAYHASSHIVDTGGVTRQASGKSFDIDILI
jgi:hypothetical protein